MRVNYEIPLLVIIFGVLMAIRNSDVIPEAKKPEQKEESNDIAEVTRRKFNRQAEIQTIKNSRLVAETHQGLLFLREQPPGPNGGYVKDLVEKGYNVNKKEAGWLYGYSV